MPRVQAVRAAQFEKEDILKNYKGLHAEKRRLEAGMDELQLARQRLTKVCLTWKTPRSRNWGSRRRVRKPCLAELAMDRQFLKFILGIPSVESCS